MHQTILRQFALWLAGQALPDEKVLQIHLENTREGFLFALVGGVLLSAVCIVLHVLLGYFLIQQGMLPSLAIGIIVLLALLVCLYCFSKARGRFSRVQQIKHDLNTHPENLLDQSEINAFIDAFKEGFNDEGKRRRSRGE